MDITTSYRFTFLPHQNKQKMLKMRFFLFLIFTIFCFRFLGLADAGQEEEATTTTIELLKLYTKTPDLPRVTPHSGLAVKVSESDLREISNSVITAESWLRTNVLSNYPSTPITTILVTTTTQCGKDQNTLSASFQLTSLRNMHHSLTRWGLENDIKLSAILSPPCQLSITTSTNPITEFLRRVNSTYTLEYHDDEQAIDKITKRLVVLGLTTTVNLITPASRRKLLSQYIPTIPNPSTVASPPSFDHALPPCGRWRSESPAEEEHHALQATKPNPSTIASPPHLAHALPPCDPSPAPWRRRRSEAPARSPEADEDHALQKNRPNPSNIASAPNAAHAFPPCDWRRIEAPAEAPAPEEESGGAWSGDFLQTTRAKPPTIASPPNLGHALPPCDRRRSEAPTPSVEAGSVWCVAKASVEDDALQAAMDYACGEGGAECGEISASGDCFRPNTVVAHASYAFNSYWQKHKKSGGTCSFGGTAMLVNTDPSYLNCRFILS